MRRRRNPSVSGINTLVIIGGVAAAAYLIYRFINQAPKLLKDATAPIANTIADFWGRLTLGPSLQVSGNVVLPDGGVGIPLSSIQIRTDAAGNVYTLLDGDLYQLGQSDANGNWPASLVLDTNFGVTGAGW
jgi:hypothetical protein